MPLTLCYAHANAAHTWLAVRAVSQCSTTWLMLLLLLLCVVCLLMDVVLSSLQRAKRPILRFKAHEGLLTSAFGEQVKQRYLVFARAVDAYITRLYADWEQVCTPT
jgi:hypothetical protein